MKKYLLALVVGAWISYRDLYNDDIQPAILHLLIASGLFAYFYPKRAYRIAFLLALCIPMGRFVVDLLHIPVPYPAGYFGGLLACIPSVIGAALGRRLRPEGRSLDY